MRLDLFLKKVRIIKRRSAAKELIDKGVVTILSEKVKPSKIVHKGMRIMIGDSIYEITEIPERKIRRNEGGKYYKAIDVRYYSR